MLLCHYFKVLLKYLTCCCCCSRSTPESVLNPAGECDLGDCVSLAVEVSSSPDAPRDPDTHSLSEPPLNTSSASQVTCWTILVSAHIPLWGLPNSPNLVYSWVFVMEQIFRDVVYVACWMHRLLYLNWCWVFWGAEDREPRDRQRIWELLLESINFWTISTKSAHRKVQIYINSNNKICLNYLQNELH